MFGPNTIRSGLSFTRILSGISRSLNFANQVIPIYQQAKPMINNARQVLSTIKEFAHSDPIKTPVSPEPIKNTVLKASSKPTSNPVFFQ